MKFLLQNLSRIERRFSAQNLLCFLFVFLAIATFTKASNSESKASELQIMAACLERLNKSDADPALETRELEIMLDSKIWEVTAANRTELQRTCSEVSNKVRDIIPFPIFPWISEVI